MILLTVCIQISTNRQSTVRSCKTAKCALDILNRYLEQNALSRKFFTVKNCSSAKMKIEQTWLAISTIQNSF